MTITIHAEIEPEDIVVEADDFVEILEEQIKAGNADEICKYMFATSLGPTLGQTFLQAMNHAYAVFIDKKESDLRAIDDQLATRKRNLDSREQDFQNRYPAS